MGHLTVSGGVHRHQFLGVKLSYDSVHDTPRNDGNARKLCDRLFRMPSIGLPSGFGIMA